MSVSRMFLEQDGVAGATDSLPVGPSAAAASSTDHQQLQQRPQLQQWQGDHYHIIWHVDQSVRLYCLY